MSPPRIADDFGPIRQRIDELRRGRISTICEPTSHGEPTNPSKCPACGASPWLKGYVCGTSSITSSRSYRSDSCPSCGANPWLKGHTCAATPTKLPSCSRNVNDFIEG